MLKAKSASIIAIDTEFIREKTYFPKLCLVQMAVHYDNQPEEYVIIDPLALYNIQAINNLLEDQRIVKVFHSCDQDIAILYHDLDCLPKPVFDTQRAAQLLGHVQQIGLAPLVKSLLDIKMDKSDTFTDWAQRPLTVAQQEYAYNDVRFLPQIYQLMTQALKDLGRLEWLDEEFARLSTASTWENDIRSAWRRVRHATSLRPKQQNALRELAAWREIQAEKRDFPRKWVASDEILIEIARRLPKTIEELYMVRGTREKFNNSIASDILAAIKTASQLPAEEWPKAGIQNIRHHTRPALQALAMALVHQRASENRIAHGILAKHEEINALVAGEREGLELLSGWRRDMVGNDLVDLMEGNICLAVNDGSLEIARPLAGGGM